MQPFRDVLPGSAYAEGDVARRLASGNVSSNQFQAQLKHDGRQKHLGNFATAESAALAVARFLRSEGITAAEADAWSSARRSCKPLFRIM